MASPIKAEDTVNDRITKLLPADVTAAFLSAKAGLVTFLGDPQASAPVFYTFVVMLLICPFYFWFVSGSRNSFQIAFLSLTFAVFALSIADVQFIEFFPAAGSITRVIAIVLPVLWAFLISQIFVAIIGQKVDSD